MMAIKGQPVDENQFNKRERYKVARTFVTNRAEDPLIQAISSLCCCTRRGELY